MKIFVILVLASINVFAQNPRVSMSPVTAKTDIRVKTLATGVCSVGSNDSGSACCSGFRIGKNKVMTNFHCLGCANKVFQKIVGNTPFMMRPANFLYSLGRSPLNYRQMVIEKINTSPQFKKYNLTADDIPRNNTELKDLLNSMPEEMNSINFETYLGNNDLKKSALKIQSIEYANDMLDVAILNIEDIDDRHYTFELEANAVVRRKPLLIIGHPHGGPNPDMKSFDVTSNCRVVDPVYDSAGRNAVISHRCDTLPGNSGSPLIDRATGKVIALHWGKNDHFQINLGIDMSAIIQDFQHTIPYL